MSAASPSVSRNPVGQRGEITLDGVRALHVDVDRDVWRTFVDWFTSPYWHSPSRLVELLEASTRGTSEAPTADGCLAETDLSRAIGAIATSGVDAPIDSLVDRYVFGDEGIDRAAGLAAAVGHARTDAVLLELHSGHVVSASLASTMAWVVAESLRQGFPGEVLHGHRSLLRRVLPVGPERLDDVALLVPLAMVLPLPAGVRARARARGFELGVPLAAYPLVAMVVPEHSAAMFPTVEPLGEFIIDTSTGDRCGRLEPLGRWSMLRFQATVVLSRPLARPVRVVVGRVAKVLGWSVERVTRSRVGRGLVARGVNVEWLWSLLRRGSSSGDNPWMTRSARVLLVRSAQVEGRT